MSLLILISIILLLLLKIKIMINDIKNIKIETSTINKQKYFFAKNIDIENKSYSYNEIALLLINLNETDFNEINSSTYYKLDEIKKRLEEIELNFNNIEAIPKEVLLYFLCSDTPSTYYLFTPSKKFDDFFNENGFKILNLISKKNQKVKFIYGSKTLSYVNNLTNLSLTYEVNIFGYYFAKEKILYIGYENNFKEEYSIEEIDDFEVFFEIFDFNKIKVLFEEKQTEKLFNTGFTKKSFYTNHDSFKSLIGSNLKNNFYPSDKANYNLKYCSGNININGKTYNVGISQNSKLWFMTKSTKFITRFNNLKEISAKIALKQRQNNNFFNEIKKISGIKKIVMCFLNYQKIYDQKPKTIAEAYFIELIEELKSIKYLHNKNQIKIILSSKIIDLIIAFKKEIYVKKIINNGGFSDSFINKKLISYLIFLDEDYNRVNDKGYYFTNKNNLIPMYNCIDIKCGNIISEKPDLDKIIRYYHLKEIINENKKHTNYYTLDITNTFNALISYFHNNYGVNNRDYYLFCLDTHQNGGNWKKEITLLNSYEKVNPKEIADYIYIEKIDKYNPSFINETIKTQLIGDNIYYINFIHCKGDSDKNTKKVVSHQSPGSLDVVMGQVLNSILYTDFKNRKLIKNQLLAFYEQFDLKNDLNNNVKNILNDICESKNQVVFEISICFPKYQVNNIQKYSEELQKFLHECQNVLSTNNIYFSFYY